ncbi:MAG TPA: LuxR C-terminal-related transcriptional regulator [Streptosporangiaceae bacterium]
MIVGRDAERVLLSGFLDAGIRAWRVSVADEPHHGGGVQEGHPGALAAILTGPAGIGKTALWEWALERASTLGYQVLISRAGIAEAQLPWVGLTDLLRTVAAPVLAALPPPQGQALQAVMLQSGLAGAADERAVGTAVWSVLSAQARAGPVMIALDDMPYMDTASAGVLRFALRRMGPESGVRLVATARGESSRWAPLDGLPGDRVLPIGVGPVSVGALFELLAARLAVQLARPVLLRVHTTSGGNPLYALELARALDRLEIVPRPGVPMPVPTSLDGLVGDRIRSLTPDVLEIAAGTAAAWRFTDAGLDPDALQRAVLAGLVVIDEPPELGDPQIVRAAHPLVSAAAYAALPAAGRRALHQRLMAHADDPLERARHAALAANRADPQIARALDAGVAAALAAGAPDIAVELSRLALQHTDSDTDRAARLDLLADALVRAGDSPGAVRAQQEAIALTPAVPLRARRRIRLAEMATEVIGWGGAADELQAAAAEAASDPVIRSEALLTLAAVTDDIALADASATEAVALLGQDGRPDPAVMSGALSQAAGARFRAGRGLDHDMFRRAIDLERSHPSRRLSDRADASYAALLKYADDLGEAETRLLALLAESRALADQSSIAYSLAHLPQIALWQGQIARARQFAQEHLDVAEQGSLAALSRQARYNLGLVMVYEGRLDEAIEMLGSPLDALGTNYDRQRIHGALGFASLSRGDPVTAAGHLDRWHAVLTAMHLNEPGYSRWHLDYLVSLVATGRLTDALAILDRLDGQVASSGRHSAAAVATTGRAMVHAASGRMPEAIAAVEQALTWYATSPLRFDRARTLLIAGQIHRRAKAKRLAQQALAEAHREFTAFGAPAWAGQAAAELARVNLRPAAVGTLTETECRVAELAAAGLTNREVGQQLFLAVKTVEANLARVYRKLGITSRAELGARMGPPRA